METPNSEQDNRLAEIKNKTKGALSLITYIMATFVLVAYGFFIYFLIGKVGSEDPDWSRLIYLFSGVEGIVFAAAGFVFGREVNRKMAQNAEKERKLAEEQKEKAKRQTVEERKSALILGAMAIQAEKTSSPTTDGQRSLEMESNKGPQESLANTARSMYPELRGI